MHLETSLRQSLEQRLLLLPRMLQSIEILQLSTVDLLARIERELAENETLELADGDPESDGTEEPVPVPTREPRAEDEEPGGEGRTAGEPEANDWLAQVPAQDRSLAEHLREQLVWFDLDPRLEDAVEFVIASLDDNGHLAAGPAELGEAYGDRERIEAAIAIVRSLDPKGLATSGPVESLRVQIPDDDPDREALLLLLDEHLEDLAANRIRRVARGLKVSTGEVARLVDRLRGFEPFPGRSFAAAERTVARPDVIVRRENGEWVVRVERGGLPRLGICAAYEALAEDPELPSEVRGYLKKKLHAARDLVASIEQRKSTLLRVAKAALARQRGFLERGVAGLRPLKMQEVADAIGVHVSTVSRTVNDKWVETDLGIFPLRILFDGGVELGTGSRSSVRERVRALVEQEDPRHPLSDEQIVQRLAAEGCTVARRTIAKYRKELGIPSSWRRRRYQD